MLKGQMIARWFEEQWNTGNVTLPRLTLLIEVSVDGIEQRYLVLDVAMVRYVESISKLHARARCQSARGPPKRRRRDETGSDEK